MAEQDYREKIKKLLALSESSNEHEAKSALLKAKKLMAEHMLFTHDCHGIAFRLVCFDCYEKLMAKGYDGQYYDEADECLDEDY